MVEHLSRSTVLETITESGQHVNGSAEPLSSAEPARVQEVVPLEDPAELSAPVWGSDEELDELLVDLRASRDAAVG